MTHVACPAAACDRLIVKLTDYDRYVMEYIMNNTARDIPLEEGYLVEFKAFKGAISVKELAKTMCAFANTDGGNIYIGVTDNRQIHGVHITPMLLDNIQNAAREVCVPSISMVLSEIAMENKKVLRISVEKSGHLHSVSAGQTYVRVGTQDKRILGEELLRLAETKSQVSFEENFLEAGLEIIDRTALNEYYGARKKVSAAMGGLDEEDLLQKMGLAKREAGGFKIKAGAFVLFGKEHDQTLLQRDFTFVKYDVEGKMYSYREDISAPAAKTLERLMELIRPYNRITGGIQGVKRQESYIYPEDAIREAVVNALAHRDYRIAGLKNECRVYPDRLEMISAGSLPNIITLENIDKRHYSRNPKIMHALLILGLTEELGQGINMMRSLLKTNGNPQPEFIANPDQFKVIFYRPRKPVSQNDARRILDDYFSANDFISRRQIESICGIGSTSAKYLIEKLLKGGYLEKVGNGPATRYEKK